MMYKRGTAQAQGSNLDEFVLPDGAIPVAYGRENSGVAYVTYLMPVHGVGIATSQPRVRPTAEEERSYTQWYRGDNPWANHEA